MAFKKGQSGNKNGRPKGTFTKPRFSDYVTEKEVKLLIAKAMKLAAQGNETMLKFCLEQHLGKAVQPTDLMSDGKSINIVIPQALADAFNINELNKEAGGSNTK